MQQCICSTSKLDGSTLQLVLLLISVLKYLLLRYCICRNIWCYVVGSLNCCFLFIWSFGRCMEATPSLACANKCVFCWRHHTNPVGKSWKWKMDDPLDIVNAAIDQHTKMVKQMKGVPGAYILLYVLIHGSWVTAWAIHCISYCPAQIISSGQVGPWSFQVPVLFPCINRKQLTGDYRNHNVQAIIIIILTW
jgi:hypothetical protein